MTIDHIFSLEPELKKLARSYKKINASKKLTKDGLNRAIERSLYWYVGRNAAIEELKTEEAFEVAKMHFAGLCPDI